MTRKVITPVCKRISISPFTPASLAAVNNPRAALAISLCRISDFVRAIAAKMPWHLATTRKQLLRFFYRIAKGGFVTVPLALQRIQNVVWGWFGPAFNGNCYLAV